MTPLALYAVKDTGQASPTPIRVGDVMTRPVITARAECPVRDAARLMLREGIGALPVVRGEEGLVGLVTAGDLTVRLGPHRPSSRWSCLMAPDRLAREYRRRTGTSLVDVMSAPVVTVTPEAGIDDAIGLLEAHEIEHLPVLEGRALVGMLTRRDLLGLIADAADAVVHRSDASIAAEMRARVARERWATASGLMVEAYHGVLWIAGIVDGDAQRSAIETMARAIPGCRGVRNHLVDRRALAARVI